MQTKVKSYTRHTSVNRAMFQFLHIQIVAIIFVILLFFMLRFPKFVLETQVPYCISGIFFNFSRGWYNVK